MIEVFVVSLPCHRELDRLAFTEVMVAAQATCGTISLTHLDVRSAAEAWQLHRLGEVPAGGVIAVIGPSCSSGHESYLEQHLAGDLARAWRADVTLCTIGSTDFLARSGLLAGRTVACNPDSAAQLKAQFPAIGWNASASCARDGNLVSSVGLLAGCEAALAVLEAVVPTVAGQVARSLRVQPTAHASRSLHPALQRALFAIHRPEPREWSTTALAGVACVSERHLQRLFKTELGCGVLDYLQRWRLAKAVRIIESNPRESLERVAESCGFTSVQQLRRIWYREYGQVPSQSRRVKQSQRAEPMGPFAHAAEPAG